MIFFLVVQNSIFISQRSLNINLFLQIYQDAPKTRYEVLSEIFNIPTFFIAIKADIMRLKIKSLESKLSLYFMPLFILLLNWDFSCNNYNKYCYGWL